MATLTANGANGHHAFTLTVTDNTPSGNFKTSVDHDLSYNFKISTGGGGYNWSGWGENIKWEIRIGSKVYSGTIPAYDGSSTVTLDSGNFAYTQSEDGTKTLDLYIKVTDSTGADYTCGNASASGKISLSTQTALSIIINYYSNYATESFSNPLNAVGSNKNVLVKQWVIKALNSYFPDSLHDYNYPTASVYLARNGYSGTGFWGTSPNGGTLIDQNYTFNSFDELAELLGVDASALESSVDLYAQWNPNGLININIKGTYVKGQTWVNNGGTWKRGIPWIKENGTWKKGGA